MRNNPFRHNLTNHLLAALLAILLWSYVKTADVVSPSDVSRAYSDVALEVRNVAANLQVTNALPQTITVTIRGAVSEVDKVTRENLLAYLDLSNARAGTGQYVVKLGVPANVSATASPARLEVHLERLMAVDVNLQPAGDRIILGDQLLVAEPSATFVRISGVESQVERVRQAVVRTNWQQTAPGDKLNLPVTLLDANGQEVAGLEATPNVIETTVHRYAGKQLQVVVPTDGELAANLRLVSITPEPATVIAYGPAEFLSATETVSTTAIDLSGIRASGRRDLDLVLPEGVLALSSEAVSVRIQTEP